MCWNTSSGCVLCVCLFISAGSTCLVGERHDHRVQFAGGRGHPVEKCLESPETKWRGPEVYVCQVWLCHVQVFPGLWGTSTAVWCCFIFYIFIFVPWINVSSHDLFSRMSELLFLSYSWPRLCPRPQCRCSGEQLFFFFFLTQIFMFLLLFLLPKTSWIILSFILLSYS